MTYLKFVTTIAIQVVALATLVMAYAAFYEAQQAHRHAHAIAAELGISDEALGGPLEAKPD